MSQWQPGQHDPRQRPPQIPPQWGNRPQYPPQPQYQPPYQQQARGPQYPPPGPPQQPRRPRRGLALLGCGGLGALAVLVAVIASSSSSSSSSAPAATVTAAQAAASATSGTAAKEAACRGKKASGDLFVRTTGPGTQAQAQEIGGQWNWDSVTGKCLSAVDFTIATAGRGDGECTTVGYVADNPGYDVNEIPAPPLKDVAELAGPGC